MPCRTPPTIQTGGKQEPKPLLPEPGSKGKFCAKRSFATAPGGRHIATRKLLPAPGFSLGIRCADALVTIKSASNDPTTSHKFAKISDPSRTNSSRFVLVMAPASAFSSTGTHCKRSQRPSLLCRLSKASRSERMRNGFSRSARCKTIRYRIVVHIGQHLRPS